MEIKKHDRIVFFGDSITEWGRDKSNPDSLGPVSYTHLRAHET